MASVQRDWFINVTWYFGSERKLATADLRLRYSEMELHNFLVFAAMLFSSITNSGGSFSQGIFCMSVVI